MLAIRYEKGGKIRLAFGNNPCSVIYREVLKKTGLSTIIFVGCFVQIKLFSICCITKNIAINISACVKLCVAINIAPITNAINAPKNGGRAVGGHDSQNQKNDVPLRCCHAVGQKEGQGGDAEHSKDDSVHPSPCFFIEKHRNKGQTV